MFPCLLGSALERDGKDPHVVRSVEMVCAVSIIGGMGGMWFRTGSVLLLTGLCACSEDSVGGGVNSCLGGKSGVLQVVHD